MKYTLYADGASRGNPGRAAGGCICYGENKTEPVFTQSIYLGEQTNNRAEYMSLINGLKECQKRGLTDINVMMDSKLVVEQMKGNYKVKNAGLKPLFIEAQQLAAEMNVSYRHIKRELNKEADALANEALDK